MAEYVDFHYLPLEGKISGESFLQQTEDVINDLGRTIYAVNVDASEIQQALDNSEQAIETANEAMRTVTTGMAIWFNTVADMVDASIDVGVVAATKGYYLVNDGGAAFYVVRTRVAGDVEDGGSIIFLDNGTTAELITNGVVNVKQFGAYGNGIDDDTTAFSNTIAYATSNSFLPIIFTGQYKVTSNISGTFALLGDVTFSGGGNVNVIDIGDFASDMQDVADTVYASATSAAASATNAQTIWTAIQNSYGYPFVASAVASMTDTSKIYVYVGSETGYTYGNWYYYNGSAWVSGGAYNAAVYETDTTLSVSGKAADAKVTGDKINELDGAVFERGIATLVTKTQSAGSSDTTNITLGTTIPNGKVCTVDITCTAVNTSHVQPVYWRNSGGNLNKIGDIPINTDHVTFTDKAPNANADRLRITYSVPGSTFTVNITSDYVVDNVAKNTTDITDINAHFPKIGKRSPITEFGTFQLGSWSNSSTFSTSNTNRVGCRTPIVFDKDVRISALNGYCMSGYRGTAGFSSVGTCYLPANTELRLYIRKMWEDSSVANVDTFTNGIYVLDYEPLTEYERLQDTFAGLEMFRTAGFIGDSYTATRLGYSWVDIVQNITGVQCTKFAKSGLNTRQWLTNTTSGLPALLADTKKDVYWIALGINDGDTVDEDSTYLGSISDISGDDYTQYPNTFYGSYGKAIGYIHNYAPKAKIVLYKPIFKSIIRTLAGQSATQNGIKEVRDAIGEIAEHYSLPCMDALDDVLYQSGWYAARMDSEVSNGTHPAVMLYPAIAKANLRLFSKCVQAYASYFMDIRYDT